MLSRYGNCFSLIELHQPFHCTDSLNACCRGNKFYSRICTPACITTWISGYTCTWVRHSQSRTHTRTHTQVNAAKWHICLHTCRHLLWIIRMTQADRLKIKISVLHSNELLFFFSSLVYSEALLISQRICKQVQLSRHYQDSIEEWHVSRPSSSAN